MDIGMPDIQGASSERIFLLNNTSEMCFCNYSSDQSENLFIDYSCHRGRVTFALCSLSM